MAIQAPTVQSLDQIMAELQPGYTAQRGVIQKGIQNTNETYKASELALDAAKTQGFNQINDQATGKGVGRAFSGLPIIEQADYLSTKYLPGLQQAKAQQQNDILTLEGQNAALDTDIRNRAFSSRESQIGAQNQWNLQQEAQRAAAEAARIERDFRASEAAKERAAQNARDAANRAAQAAANRAAAKPKAPSLEANIRAYLNNYVNPETGTVPKKVWQNAVQLAYESGMKFGGDKGFASTFWGYADDNKWQDYKIGYDKYLQ